MAAGSYATGNGLSVTAHRVENYRFPKADTERQQLASVIGADGFALLQAAYAHDAPAEVRSALALEVLRQIWVQQYYGPRTATALAAPTEMCLRPLC